MQISNYNNKKKQKTSWRIKSVESHSCNCLQIWSMKKKIKGSDFFFHIFKWIKVCGRTKCTLSPVGIRVFDEFHLKHAFGHVVSSVCGVKVAFTLNDTPNHWIGKYKGHYLPHLCNYETTYCNSIIADIFDRFLTPFFFQTFPTEVFGRLENETFSWWKIVFSAKKKLFYWVHFWAYIKHSYMSWCCVCFFH